MTGPELAPVLTMDTPKGEQVPGQAEVVNGSINLRRTHPALWRSLMIYAVANVALGLNFIVLTPTFLIYGASNYLWGAIFLTIGTAMLVFMNIYRNLRLVRMTMAAQIVYMLVIALGTTEPFFDGTGSLQLPILYIGGAALALPLLVEPFLNPWTAKRE